MQVPPSNPPDEPTPRAFAPFQQAFADAIAHDPRLAGGRVLDIGCGNFLHASLQFIPRVAARYDGVDPSDVVLANARLAQRWHGPFETAPIPPASYDLAFAYTVVEHIAHPRPFFEAVARVLRPGGAFYALTPNAHHPFAWMSRGAELVGLKALLARRMPHVNNYPAYYRLNSERRVRRALAGLPLRLSRTWFVDQLGWERGYLPRGLRFVPAMYDRLVASRIPLLRQSFLYQLEREA